MTPLRLLACLLAITLPCSAAELWSNEEGTRAVALDTSLKLSALASYGIKDRFLYPERFTGIGLFRLRLGLDVQLGARMDLELAYEQRARQSFGGGAIGGGGGILPSYAKAPYRIVQLDSGLARSGATFDYRHELDRALLVLHPDWGAVTIGRQAIGLGRGVLFGAVDIFTPFAPAEVDREWRRGVDAIRIERRIGDTGAVEVLAAFGESFDDSAILVRARNFFGNLDGEIIAGKRAEDAMLAGVLSATVGDAEVHAELAFFHTPESQPGALFGSDHLVAKAVLGSSYTFDVGHGLTIFAEYHYSGFGLQDISDAVTRFLDPKFQERFLRGDLQILGRHALAFQFAYPIGETLGAGLLVLENPADGSGLTAPSLSWSFSQQSSLSLSAFFPWGAKPRRGLPRSEYGASPMNLFVQLATYF